MYFLNFIRGFCMSLADSVPGVSGGTVAFLLGFYDKFVVSLNNLISGSKEEKIEALKFLLKIGIGWIVGFILAMLVLGSIFENQIYKISSVFLGFIVFAIPMIIIEEKNEFKGNYKNIIFTIIGICIVVGISLFSPSSGNGVNLSVENLSFGLGTYVFFSAMIAISALLVPGISGSTLLLIFGLYIPIVTAVKEFLHFNFSYLPVIIIFCLGVLAGVITVIKIIKTCLEKYRSKTLYIALGLMIGSIYPIILGPTTLEVPQEAMTIQTFSILFFLIGGAIILGLQKLKKLK